MMAYEPEAAAVFCKRLTRDLMAANDNPVHFAIQQSYIVVDLGGRYSYIINCSVYVFILLIS